MRIIKEGAKAFEGIKSGIDSVCNVVKLTMGAKGKNVIINDNHKDVQVINDGVSIAKEIFLPTSVENTGATLAKRVAEKTNYEAGDGTTTSLVLLQAFIEGMHESEEKDKRQLREDIKKIVEAEIIPFLEDRSVEIDTNGIQWIAKISSLDDEIASVVQEVIKEVGMDGAISVEDGRGTKIDYEVVEGLRIDDGFASHYFATDQEMTKGKLENVPVLVITKPLLINDDIIPTLEILKQAGYSSVAIFCTEITEDVLGFLVINKIQGNFGSMVIKTADYKDIATVTGSEIISPESGKDVDMKSFGLARKVEVTKHDTTVIGDENVKDEIDKKVENMKSLLETTEDADTKIELQESIARITGGVAVIRVGGGSQQELKERKLKLEDALNASRAALEEGVVEGGGLALHIASETLDMSGELDSHEAKRIVYKAIRKPMEQILQNADEDPSKVIRGIMERNEDGYNVVTRQYENFMENGIVDPLKVTKCALRNSLSMATSVMTSGAVIVEKD